MNLSELVGAIKRGECEAGDIQIRAAPYWLAQGGHVAIKGWGPLDTGVVDFAFTKPKQWRPWTASEVPKDAWFRSPGSNSGIRIDQWRDGYFWLGVPNSGMQRYAIDVSGMSKLEFSTDGGKTWQRGGVTE